MAVIPLDAGAVLQVNFFGTLHGQRVMNTFHYMADATPDPLVDYRTYISALKDQLATVDTGLIATLNALWPNNAYMDHMKIQPVYPERQRYVQYPLAIDGTVGDDADTANVAMSIRRNAEVIGRMGVGRVQIPLADLYRVDGYVDLAALIIPLEAFTDALLAIITTVTPAMTWQPILFGISLDPLAPYVNTSPLFTATPEDTIRVMRRRTVRLGE